MLATDETPRHNLPDAAQLGHFVGRANEVAELNRRLANAACRLLTLAASVAPAEQSGAVQLFLQSARQFWARFTPSPDELSWVVRICQLVDGLPLGLELATTWVHTVHGKSRQFTTVTSGLAAINDHCMTGYKLGIIAG